MTKQELKAEIESSLDNVPERVPAEILSLFKNAGRHPESQLTLIRDLLEILTEDECLLERLAK